MPLNFGTVEAGFAVAKGIHFLLLQKAICQSRPCGVCVVSGLYNCCWHHIEFERNQNTTIETCLAHGQIFAFSFSDVKF